MTAKHHRRPGWLTKNVWNRLMMLLGRAGISVVGHRTLAVRGRKSGEWRTVPVNPLEFEGQRYLVAPRGETDWVRNIRVAGGGELRRGSQAEPVRVEEVPDDEKEPILRAYLKKWGWETRQFFEGVKHDAPPEDIRRIAPNRPVFRIVPDASSGDR